MAPSPLFEIHELSLPGVFSIKPKIFSDARGYSVVVYNATEFLKLGIATDFNHDFKSFSVKNVIRGLHFQHAPYAQEKLVRCTHGEVFDVVVDHDPTSATFGTHISVPLIAEEQTMLYVPGKYAHGFCVISDSAVVEYKIAGAYHPESADGIPWNDQAFRVNWPTSTPILSDQDKSWEPIRS